VHAKSSDTELIEDGQLYLITGPNRPWLILLLALNLILAEHQSC
jgi:hypothetical protein